MSLQDFQGGRVVFGDGQGRIWTSKGDGSDPVLFPHWGRDPSFCWGGAAIIFVDYDRHGVWVANRDGSGLYGLGVWDNYIARPQLAANNTLYVLNSRNSAGMWDVYVCGAGAYGLTHLLTSIISPGVISQDGALVFAGGWTGSTYRICWVRTDGSAFGWIPYTPPSAEFPHVAMPTVRNNELAFMIGNFAGLNILVPSTYKTSDIGVSNLSNGVVTRLQASPPGPGYLVMNPSWWVSGKPTDGLIYDFVTPNGCGIWALSIPGRGSGGAGVYGNPNGGAWQFGDMGCNRVTLTP